MQLVECHFGLLRERPKVTLQRWSSRDAQETFDSVVGGTCWSYCPSTRFVCHPQGLCDTAQPTHIWSYLFKSIHYPLMSQTSKISNVSLRDQHWIEKAQFAVCSFGILNVLISSVWNVHNRHCCRHAEEIWAPPASAPISIGLACLFCPQKTCSVTRLVLLQGSQIEQQHRRVLDGK